METTKTPIRVPVPGLRVLEMVIFCMYFSFLCGITESASEVFSGFST
jgi:hypothetical protein